MREKKMVEDILMMGSRPNTTQDDESLYKEIFNRAHHLFEELALVENNYDNVSALYREMQRTASQQRNYISTLEDKQEILLNRIKELEEESSQNDSEQPLQMARAEFERMQDDVYQQVLECTMKSESLSSMEERLCQERKAIEEAQKEHIKAEEEIAKKQQEMEKQIKENERKEKELKEKEEELNRREIQLNMRMHEHSTGQERADTHGMDHRKLIEELIERIEILTTEKKECDEIISVLTYASKEYDEDILAIFECLKRNNAKACPGLEKLQCFLFAEITKVNSHLRERLTGRIANEQKLIDKILYSKH